MEVEKGKIILDDVKQDIDDLNYYKLRKLIEPLKTMCEQLEKPDNILDERAMVKTY